MILTLKIKLTPNIEQKELLLRTMELANSASNYISNTAWESKTFNQFKLHHLTYHETKAKFNLSSQMVARCLAKVADSYKIDKKVKRVFNKYGAISYDNRILTYKPNDIVSIWSIEGRIKIPFICHNINYLPFIKGEADLVYKNDKFYLFQSVNVPDEPIKDIEEFIGCDFGLNDLVVTSDGIKHSADWLNTYREKRQKIRSSIQSKGTKGAKKLLKRLSGRERTTATIINHTISKSIVKSAKDSNKGIAIEDLTNIRFTSKRRSKKFKTKLGRWNFADLRAKLEYKAKLSGVKLIIVEPRYTSKTCSCCHYIGVRNNKSFKCNNCGHNEDADFNASKNIATLGVSINTPEINDMFCYLHNVSVFKTHCL